MVNAKNIKKMEKKQYTPIVIESLIFDKNSDYPLYLKSGDNYILYRSKALIFSQSDALRLKNIKLSITIGVYCFFSIYYVI